MLSKAYAAEDEKQIGNCMCDSVQSGEFIERKWKIALEG